MDLIRKQRMKKHEKKRSQLIFYFSIFIGVVIFTGFLIFTRNETSNMTTKKSPISYHGNIISSTEINNYYRRVVFTGLNSQLVIMSIPPGGEVGKETHKYTEQTLFFLSGKGEGELNGKRFPIVPGDVVVVVPETEHNFWNTGTVPLKIYTVYAPPNHIDGRIQKTKADADADKTDEAVGEKAPIK